MLLRVLIPHPEYSSVTTAMSVMNHIRIGGVIGLRAGFRIQSVDDRLLVCVWKSYRTQLCQACSITAATTVTGAVRQVCDGVTLEPVNYYQVADDIASNDRTDEQSCCALCV